MTKLHTKARFPVLLILVLAAQAHSQSAPSEPVKMVMFNGIDLKTGKFIMPLGEIAIGQSSRPEFRLQWGPGTTSPFMGNVSMPVCNGNNIQFCSSTVYVRMGDYSETLSRNVAISSSGTSMTVSNGNYTVTDRSGTKWLFLKSLAATAPSQGVQELGVLSKVTFPDGRTWSYSYSGGLNITSSTGYQLRNESAKDSLGRSGVRAKMVNLAYINCPTPGLECGTQYWPSVLTVLHDNIYDHTSNTGAVTSATASALTNHFQVVTEAGAVSTYDTATKTYGTQSGISVFTYITSLTTPVNSWTFSYTIGNYPLSPIDRVMIDSTTATDNQGRVTKFGAKGPGSYSLTDPNGKSRNYYFSTTSSLYGGWKEEFANGYVDPEGDSRTLTRDLRGNIIADSQTSKDGTTKLVVTYDFPTSCVNFVTCNKPTSVTDARGKITNYTYDPVHGGVSSESAPAGEDGIRPVKRSAYVQRYAWILNGNGGYAHAGEPIWVLSSEKTCLTSSTTNDTCASGAQDEVVTTFDYGPDAGPNNLSLRGIAVTANGTTRRVCYGYDQRGNRTWETKHAAGLAACPAA